MLIDLHAHTSGISKCCRAPALDILTATKDAGLDGIVLTNHHHKPYLNNGMTASEFARKYVDEFEYTKKIGEEMGVKVFFGIEVTMEKCDGAHVLVYGASTDFVIEYPEIFDISLEDLYAIARERGYAIVHAHPYRHGKDVLDIKYLDGVEVNCHGNYDATHWEKLYGVAKENGIMLTCGGDYHADNYRPKCGTYLPDEVKSELDIANFILHTDKVKLRIHELREKSYFETEFYLPRAEKYTV